MNAADLFETHPPGLKQVAKRNIEPCICSVCGRRRPVPLLCDREGKTEKSKAIWTTSMMMIVDASASARGSMLAQTAFQCGL
uniref:Uncharacterized protein n=1 Tax=Panagrellus redivivus TaxID=6233 RepID=A0A7E4ZS37_PANRE